MTQRPGRLDIAACGSFFVFATSSAITPLCLASLSGELSINLTEGGGLETARTLLLVGVLLVAGFCAQRWGKKRFLVLGLYLLAAGLVLFSFARSYQHVIGAILVVGAGCGFVEALINPLVSDMHPEAPGKHLNLTNAFYSIGVLVSVLVFGELLTRGVGWRTLFRLAAALALGVGLLLHTSRFPPPTEEREGRHTVRDIASRGRFWLFAAAIFLGAGVESAFTFWSATYIQTYYAHLPRAGAFGMAVFGGTMAAGRLLTGRMADRVGLRRIMIGSAAVGVVVSCFVLTTTRLAGVYVLLAAAGFCAASFWPSVLAVAGKTLRVGSTLLFVMLACAGIAGYGLTPWLIGLIGDLYGLRTGLAVVPVVFAALAAVLVVEARIQRPPGDGPE